MISGNIVFKNETQKEVAFLSYAIKIENLSHDFNLGKTSVNALNHINLTIMEGEFVALVGKSGSGKSTLLNIIAGLMHPTSGRVNIKGEIISDYDENELCIFRQTNIGFIFQSFNLLNNYSALENVEMPLIFSGMNRKERAERAKEMIQRVDLTDRARHKPNELSGGQQQRVSIARALINNPPILLADEPTGNLDSQNGQDIMALIRQLNIDTGATIVMVTHDMDFARYAKRIVYLKDGCIVKDEVLA